MNEHIPRPEIPEPSESDEAKQGVHAPLDEFAEDDRARGARFYDEAAALYLTYLQSPDSDACALEPMTEPWLDFNSSYMGSFDGRDAFVDHVIDELGWFRIIYAMSTQGGIPVGVVRLDYAAVYDYLKRYFHIFTTPERVLHVFSRTGVQPMPPDCAPRGGAL